jgi:riboflavin kinase/FMN adenylyltransferase
MEIIKGKDFSLQDTCVTIGKFDGVHIGHRKILNKMKEICVREGLKSVVITFDYSYFNTDSAGRLNTYKQKTDILENTGIDIMIDYPFDDETRNLSAADFIRLVLVNRLGVKAVIVGENFRFGRGAEGNTGTLDRYGRMYGFETVIVPSVCYDGKAVSSTRIREEIVRGNRDKADDMLGF